MLTKIQNFFLELRQSDQENKKRWLVILTSAAMILIISFWIIYFNLTIKNLSQKEESASQFWETMKVGLGVIYQKTASELSRASANLQEILKKTNSVTIQAENFQTVMPNLEEIKPKKLP